MIADPTLEPRRLIIAAADPDPAALEPFRETTWADLRWPWLIDRARAHKLHGLLATRMLDTGLVENNPASVRDLLLKAKEHSRAKAARARATFIQVADAYGADNIRFFLVKGDVLAEHIYRDPEVRPFGDVDLVVDERDFARAEAVLAAMGFMLYRPPIIRSWLPRSQSTVDLGTLPQGDVRQLLFDHHRHLIYVVRKEDPRVPVELHWQLASPGIIRTDPRGPWRETVEMEVAGRRVRTLGPEATLVHLAVHAMEQPPLAFRLLHLADVAWVATRWGSRIDISRLRRIAVEWGAEHHLAAAFRVMADLWPSTIRGEARSWPAGRRWTRTCLRLAGIGETLVEEARVTSTARHLSSRLRRETFWELALARPPMRAARSLRAAVVSAAGRGSDARSLAGIKR